MLIDLPSGRSWIGLSLLFLLACFDFPAECARGQTKAKSQETSDKGSEISNLLKKRRDTLQRAVTLLTAQYQTGTVPFEWVYRAQRDVLRATLDLDISDAERIAALRQNQETAKGLVKLTKGRLGAGAVTEVDVVQAEAVLLEARIELLREQLKEKVRK